MSLSSAATSSVASSASSVNLFAATDQSNASGRAIFNDSAAVLYVKFGSTASSSSYTVQLAAGAYFEFPWPVYCGAVDGIWSSANGNARLTAW